MTLADTWTIERMAKQTLMSERTFIRRFNDATGCAPGEWLIAERITRAKELLCHKTLSVEAIADAVGLSGAHALRRHHFRARVGITPTAYRRQFALD